MTAIRGIAVLAVTGLTRLERLPDLSALTELRWLELAWLPRLADVTPIISSTSLRYLMLFNMDQVKAQHLRETLDRSTVEVATLLHQAGGDGRSSPLPRMRDAGLPFESRFA